MVTSKKVQQGAQLRLGATRFSQGATTAAAGATTAAQAAALAAAQRLQAAAASMQVAAQGAATAAQNMNTGVKSSTYSARSWAAPRLESAANYTTSTLAPKVSDTLTKQVAPKVSSALLSTSRQVSPEPVKQRSSMRSLFTWGALVGAVLAAAGAAGIMAWRRYRAAMEADTEPDTVVVPPQDAGPNGAQTTPTTTTATTTDTQAPIDPTVRRASSTW